MTEQLSVVCWKWRGRAGYRSTFSSVHVNTLRRMVTRHYPKPHRFFCVTDDPAGLDDGVIAIPLWDDHSRVLNPHGLSSPSCYRRLKIFSHEAKSIFGERVVSLDLDVVITGDLRALWDRPEDFVIWGDTAKSTPYNGSMFLLRTGTRTDVWTRFSPTHSPRLTKSLGYIGSDQAWIAAVLGGREPIWTVKDGVYSYRNHVHNTPTRRLPVGARIVIFHGKYDPWSSECQRLHWVSEHYR